MLITKDTDFPTLEHLDQVSLLEAELEHLCNNSLPNNVLNWDFKYGVFDPKTFDVIKFNLDKRKKKPFKLPDIYDRNQVYFKTGEFLPSFDLFFGFSFAKNFHSYYDEESDLIDYLEQELTIASKINRSKGQDLRLKIGFSRYSNLFSNIDSDSFFIGSNLNYNLGKNKKDFSTYLHFNGLETIAKKFGTILSNPGYKTIIFKNFYEKSLGHDTYETTFLPTYADEKGRIALSNFRNFPMHLGSYLLKNTK